MSYLFLGVGNLERADDGVGPFIAQALAEDGELASLGVEILPHSGEGVSLMQLWEGLDKVVIVDAMKAGGSLGSVTRFDVTKRVLHGGVFHYSSHLFGLAEAVEVARKLDKLPKELIIYGIESCAFGFGEPFSKPVAKAIVRVLDSVREEFGIVLKKRPQTRVAGSGKRKAEKAPTGKAKKGKARKKLSLSSSFGSQKANHGKGPSKGSKASEGKSALRLRKSAASPAKKRTRHA